MLAWKKDYLSAFFSLNAVVLNPHDPQYSISIFRIYVDIFRLYQENIDDGIIEIITDNSKVDNWGRGDCGFLLTF